MNIPPDIPTVITRERFRELVDPLLAALNVTAEDVRSCSFDGDGFTLVVFERDSEGRRIAVCGGNAAKQTIAIHIAAAVKF